MLPVESISQLKSQQEEARLASGDGTARGSTAGLPWEVVGNEKVEERTPGDGEGKAMAETAE